LHSTQILNKFLSEVQFDNFQTLQRTDGTKKACEIPPPLREYMRRSEESKFGVLERFMGFVWLIEFKKLYFYGEYYLRAGAQVIRYRELVHSSGRLTPVHKLRRQTSSTDSTCAEAIASKHASLDLPGACKALSEPE
jgi:hypothetical protein